MTVRRGLQGGVAGLLSLALAACAVPSPNGGAAANASRPKASAAPGAGGAVAPGPQAPLGGLGAGQLGAAAQPAKLFFPLRLTPRLPASLLGNDGASLLANDGAAVVQDGSSLIANDGAALLANDGGGLIANDGSGLLGNDGAGLIGNDGGGLIGNDGAGVVASGGGNYRLAQAQAEPVASPAKLLASVQDKIWTQSSVSFSADQMLWAWAKRGPRLGTWSRYTTNLRLLPLPKPLAGVSSINPELFQKLMELFNATEERHFASYWRMVGSEMRLTGYLLPRADAPASEGLAVTELRTSQPGEIEIRCQHLEKLDSKASTLGVEGVSLWVRFKFNPDGTRRIEIVMAKEAAPLQAPWSVLSIVQAARIWNRTTYEVAADGTLAMRYSEHFLQKPFSKAIIGIPQPVQIERAAVRNLIAARTSGQGLAAWMRFSSSQDFSSAFVQDSVAATSVFAFPNGDLTASPSEALRATLPGDELAKDAAYHLPIPTEDSPLLNEARFEFQPLSEADFQASGAQVAP